ncbi:alanine racemase [uncultured Roseobacter sp.]|uniref:alanine racemase n=1 Tax=uncultured Roseobacter sp. TaxID=114847 RepID=UPI002612395E|nr:alanine racemase [uncultured Roseobacter sp.]
MAIATLTIDLSAVTENWRNLNAMAGGKAAAVVKADAYGLGMPQVVKALTRAGARTFFVAVAEEGAALRKFLGKGPQINVFAGHMERDTPLIRDAELTPMLNSIDQMLRHVEALPGHPFGIQLDTGMNRLGMEDPEWTALREVALEQRPTLIMSHLACADAPDHAMNARQLQVFNEMTQDVGVPRSLAATGGTLLGPDYHFDMVRPGIGLYGGLPYIDARPAVSLYAPVIQIRDVAVGETVGYSNTWVARGPSRIATIAAGYADGIIRAMGPNARLHTGSSSVPVVGRISMDLIGVDVTGVAEEPEHLEVIGPHQSVDTVAGFADTIGYEILTSLGARYKRVYL